MKRISPEVIGLIEWESATLDMSFVDDYQDEVNALLDAQLEACEKEHDAKVRELIASRQPKERFPHNATCCDCMQALKEKYLHEKD